MALTSSRRSRRPSTSGRRNKTRGTGGTSDASLSNVGKDTLHGKAHGSDGAVTQSERAWAEERPEEEDDINQDYDLTKSSFDPIEGYPGSEQEATLAVMTKPALHDSLLRYVTETKYLIDLVPTRKEIVGDERATEAVPEQSSSSSTTSSSETEEEGGDADQDLADGEYYEQMEIDYKGTEGTREDMGGGAETYHPIP